MKVYLDFRKLGLKSMSKNFNSLETRFNGAIRNYAFYNVCPKTSRLVETKNLLVKC